MTTKTKNKRTKTEKLTKMSELVNGGLNKESTVSETLMVIAETFFEKYPPFKKCGVLPPSISTMLEDGTDRINLDEWDSEKDGLSGYGKKWDFNKVNIIIETINASDRKMKGLYGLFDPNDTTTIEGKDHKVIRIREDILEPENWWNRKHKNGITVLIHELVHMVCHFNGVSDCVKNVHNQKFMSMANHFGLKVIESRKGKKKSYDTPALKDEFIKWFEKTFDMEILNKIFSKKVINRPYARGNTKVSFIHDPDTFYPDNSYSGGKMGFTVNVPSKQVEPILEYWDSENIEWCLPEDRREVGCYPE